MRALLRRALPVLVVAGVLLVPAVASAHPLGNFTISTSAGIVLSPGDARIDYVVDMAEIPTVQERPELDTDGDGTINDAERSAWASATATAVLANLELSIAGRPLTLEVAAASATLLPGQGGLETLRLDATFVADVDANRGSLAFEDANYDGQLGWHEVTAAGVDGVRLSGSDVPTTSRTDRLRSYPQDLLASPLDVRSATASFALGVGAGSADAAGATGTTDERPAVVGGAFADLVDRTGPLMLVALLLAFGFGAMHALGPGHGKTLMAAYLVGSGGRIRQAVAVGGAVATMHTASVLMLGFVVLGATSVFAPERVYPWLGLGSGLVALALGAALLVTRIGRWSDGATAHPHAEHEHEHGPHTHSHATPDAPVLSRRGLVGLAVAGGILPSPTALVVLLAAVAAHRVGYGLALIAAFSLGLATALTVVGILALGARDVVQRRLSNRTARLVPVLSATAMVALGLVLTVNGATQL
jgi:nickel/cobalt transporter (NicO) family protein